MWQLRFNNGITSAGFVLDSDQKKMSVEEQWKQLLKRYPAIESQFNGASLVSPDSGLVSTGRLQRGWQLCAGSDWALLPHTAGFIDPLHSTGIAHTLCGIERLIEAIEKNWGQAGLTDALMDYSESMRVELELIDELVACCYRSSGNFELFTASTLFYFAAATSFEHQRSTGRAKPLFLCAEDREFKRVTREWLDQVSQIKQSAVYNSNEIRQAIQFAENKLTPWNRVGLFCPRISNMYHYTAAPESEPL